CLSFSYHMFGDSMGTLKVYLSEFGAEKVVLWSRSGDHGNDWIREQLDYYPKTLYQIIFEAVAGGYRSDVAIDDVKIRPGPCFSYDSVAVQQGGIYSRYPSRGFSGR
ncbi:hypothetical protein LOTGIDRAFT_106513, partial [Lottia gigantea]